VEGALIANSLEHAISLCGDDPEVFLIGGAELYLDGLRLANKLYITEIKAEYEGDAFFPQYDQTQWKLTSRDAHSTAQGLAYEYLIYER